MTEVSSTTKAILMLVAPLLAGGRTETGLLLTPTEYRHLALTLQRLERRPSDLLGPGAAALLGQLESDFDRMRLAKLLGRGMQLGMALEHWQRYSIQVISRADTHYPRRLKKTLGHRSPALLYFCGNADLLHSGGLAVVGSRKADEELLTYTRTVGALAAAAGCTIVSGGAKGVDQASMQGAAAAGGRVVGILAHNLERTVMQRDNRNALLRQELLLCSPFDPATGFRTWQAMDRNKLIYALADVALVVQAEAGKGGTWSGAKEQLRKYHCVPVYTRTSGSRSRGLDALRDLGACSWPEPDDVTAFRTVMESAASTFRPGASPVGSSALPAGSGPAQEDRARPDPAEDAGADELWEKAAELILRLLETESATAEVVARKLRVESGQARTWLEQLVETNKLVKTSRPVRYQRMPDEPALGEDHGSLALGQEGSAGTPEEAGIDPALSGPDPEMRTVTAHRRSVWATELRDRVENLLLRLLAHGPLSSQDVAAGLELKLGQTQAWLQQMVDAGTLTKTSRPVKYQVAATAQASADHPLPSGNERGDAPVMPQGQLPPPGRRPSVATPTAQALNMAVWAEELRTIVEDLLLRLLAHEALSVESVAQALRAKPSQVRAWLDPLVEADQLTRTSRPIRYQRHAAEQQSSML